MPEQELKKIADGADMIVAGYSFTRDADGNWFREALRKA